MHFLAGLAGLLVLFDGYVTHRRIKMYGSFAEVNPCVRQLIQDFGLTVGLLVGLVQNLVIITFLVWFGLPLLLAFFAGVKFGLTLMQLKSLQMEAFVEKVLAKARAKKA